MTTRPSLSALAVLAATLALSLTSSCSLAPDTAWDAGDPFARVRLLFDS